MLVGDKFFFDMEMMCFRYFYIKSRMEWEKSIVAQETDKKLKEKE